MASTWPIAVLGLMCAFPCAAEQYRSKLLLNPQTSLTESARLSISELEAGFKSLSSAYAKASVGSQLARHFVQQGDYEKAIEYYQSALQADALAPLVALELRRELAEIYLLDGQPRQARLVLQVRGPVNTLTDASLVLTQARIQFALGEYLPVADTLEYFMQIAPLVQAATVPLYQQVVALAYGIQDFALCSRALKLLLEHDPANPEYWSQMVSLQLKQQDTAAALQYLMLARRQGLLRDEANGLLLSSLYVLQGNPFAGAQLLQQEMEQGIVAASGEHYKRLFEYWWQAREQGPALSALAQAAQRTGEAPLYLFWAQTLMQQSRWPEMQQALLQLCQKPVAAEYLSRANLLLGISRYELDQPELAFQAFASATLTGGANTQAGHWLRKLEAEGVNGSLPARPSGPCQPRS
ncbi:tetratricopeptide repeat protein [Ketobacter sp.]|uniref:tetratricopeptide repeat protein n=1 Tax=Ketobacter sp. TaxID=2083498 RepID=UPI0025BB7D85|nr:tetratricopeptide repeat protein [Ketobacter sp.]